MKVSNLIGCKSVKRIALVVLVLTLILVSMTVVAFADPSSAIQDGVKKGTSEIWKIIKSIVTPVCAVVFAWNVFKIMFGGEKGMDVAKKNILIVVIVIALVYLAPVIVQQISTWFAGTGDGGVFK